MDLLIFKGTLVNVLAIFFGGVAGRILGNRIPKRAQERLVQIISLCVVVLGLKMAVEVDNFLYLITGMIFGGLLGEWWRLEDRLISFARFMGKGIPNKNENFEAGFVSATILYAVGSMAVLGAIEDALLKDSTLLYTKSLMDGLSAVCLAASLGMGVAFSAIPVGIYQGFIALCAFFLAPYLTDEAIAMLSSSGGVLILAIGFNLLGMTKLPIGNWILGMFVATALVLMF